MLFLAEVAAANNYSLLDVKFACYSLQKLLVANNYSLLDVKFACYSLQKLLAANNFFVTRCKICLLLLAEVARCKKLLVTRNEKNPEADVYLKPIKIGEFYLLILYLQLPKNRKKILYTIKLAWQKYNPNSTTYNKIFQRKYTFIIKTITQTKKIKSPLSDLRQFMTTEIPLEMMKNAFYFMSKVFFVLEIFTFLF